MVIRKYTSTTKLRYTTSQKYCSSKFYVFTYIYLGKIVKNHLNGCSIHLLIIKSHKQKHLGQGFIILNLLQQYKSKGQWNYKNIK